MNDGTTAKRNPDPLGLQIARAIQEAVQPAEVILYGSRAVGEHRQDSDVDILIVTQDRQGAGTAATTAQNWLNTVKLDADVSIRTMTLEEFDRRRRLGQSLAGQASRHGINAMGRQPEYHPQHQPHDEEIWQEARSWLQISEESRQDYNVHEDINHQNLKALGYQAQQALENAIKGILAAHDDQSRFLRDLSAMWDYIDRNLPWTNNQEAQEGKRAVRKLMDYVTFQEHPSGQTLNWLTTFDEGYRHEIVPRNRTWEERKELQYPVNRAVTALQDEALRQRGSGAERPLPRWKTLALGEVAKHIRLMPKPQ